MTIQTSFRLIRGIIPWYVLSAVDGNGFVHAVIMGAEYNRCLCDMNHTILNIEQTGDDSETYILEE